MSLRSRTIRRLSILLGAAALVAAVATALYFRNEHLKVQRLNADRQAGMAAYRAGDYRTALDELKRYVARRHDDNEALYAYGVARWRIEEDDGRNIAEAINIFNALLQRDPDNQQARDNLLDLYLKASYSREAMDLADRMLLANPEDVHALRAKCIALNRLHLQKEALAVSQKLNQLQPHDFEQQLTTYQLMRALKVSTFDLVSRADQALAAHRNDARFELLAALVHGWTGDVPGGRALLRQASTRPAPDATFVRYIVRVLDSQKMYRQAQDVLDRAARQDASDPAILRMLAQRLWQNGQYQQVIDRLADQKDPTADAALLAWRAMALFGLHRVDQANQLVVALSKRKSDPDAIAWSVALKTWFDGDDPADALTRYRAALDRAPDNAVIRSLEADAYAHLGERELAVQAWRRSAELAPSWASPRISAARALLANGQVHDAIVEAQAAFSDAPESLDAGIALALCQYGALERGEMDAAHEAALLALVEQIQKAAPQEPQTLPAYVNLLVRAGRKADAVAAISAELALPPARQSAAAIERLISTSRAEALGREAELSRALDALGARAGADPHITLATAADLAITGRASDGLALIEARAGAASTQPAASSQEAAWGLVRAQYLEMIHDRRAASAWQALGERYPRDLDIQIAILRSGDSAWADREFISRTIDRVKTLTGPQGQTWKLERARWLIGGDSGKDAAEAVNTLTEIVQAAPQLREARLLLASAYEKLGNLPAATTQIQAASDQDPDDPTLSVEVARLMQAQNQFISARQYLDRASASNDLTADLRRRIASLDLVQGDLAQAIKLLQDAGDALTTPGKLLLADLLRRQNRSSDAEAIYQKLLAQRPVLVQTLRAAADFYALQDKPQEAQKILARLSEATTRPSVMEMVRGEFEQRHGSTASASRHFAAATQAAPDDPAAWQALIGFHLAAGDYDLAHDEAGQALGDVGDGTSGLKTLQAAAATLTQLLNQHPQWKPALSALAESVMSDPAAASALAQWHELPSSRPAASPADLLGDHLRQLIARSPRSEALRRALVQSLLLAGRVDEAADAASKAMDDFPAEADFCRAAASADRLLGRTDSALAAARMWRQRMIADPAPADRMIAEILLAAGDPAGALATLQPYAAEAIAHPDDHAAMLVTLLRAQVRSGALEPAQKTIEPLLAKHVKWRLACLQIAAVDISDHAAAGRWIKMVQSAMPAGHVAELSALGSAWYQLGERFNDSSDEARAAKVLDPIVAAPSAPLSAVLFRAQVAAHQNDTTAAEALYRRALKLSPDQPDALNNLAFLLYSRNEHLDEARALAERAIRLSPDNSSFYDTLARIQVRQKDLDSAMATFRKAVLIGPDNLPALIGLGTALCDSGHRDQALSLLARIDSLAKSTSHLSDSLQQELDRLRSTLKAAPNRSDARGAVSIE